MPQRPPSEKPTSACDSKGEQPRPRRKEKSGTVISATAFPPQRAVFTPLETRSFLSFSFSFTFQKMTLSWSDFFFNAKTQCSPHKPGVLASALSSVSHLAAERSGCYSASKLSLGRKEWKM